MMWILAVVVLLRTGEAVCCLELLDTKVTSDQVTAVLALLPVSLIFYWLEWFLL